MSDSSIVDPAGSSYSLPKPTDVPVGDVPQMEMERVLPRQQSTGLARGVQQLGTPNLSVDSGENHIIVADTVNQVNTNRVLMGNQTTFGEGFYVTKPGIDVKTAKSADDFIFNSNQNVFKIAQVGTTTINVPNTSTNVYFSTITHNLGYVPLVISFVKPAFNGVTIAQYQQMPYLPLTSSGAVGGAYVILEACMVTSTTTTQVTFEVNAGPDNVTGKWNIKYYLLQESAS